MGSGEGLCCVCLTLLAAALRLKARGESGVGNDLFVGGEVCQELGFGMMPTLPGLYQALGGETPAIVMRSEAPGTARHRRLNSI